MHWTKITVTPLLLLIFTKGDSIFFNTRTLPRQESMEVENLT